MPRRSKGPRLWLRPAQHDNNRKLTHTANWLVLDGNRQARTGLGPGASEKEKEQALIDYLAQKHAKFKAGSRDPSQILIEDVLAKYVKDVVSKHADPGATVARIQFLLKFWSGHTLDYVVGDTCREYIGQRSTSSAARRELEDFRAAINHHRKEGLHDRIVSVVLPPKGKSRELWFEPWQAAAAVRAAYRYREIQKGQETDKHPRRHVARFMVWQSYMGSRPGVATQVSIEDKRPSDRPWCDLRHGVFYGLPESQRETKRRRQRVRIPRALLQHLRRWRRMGARYVVEWRGEPVGDIHKAHDAAIADVGLGPRYTPHIWRHTVATWAMQGGADPWKTAEFLGMSYDTLVRVYGHHRPDDSEEVHRALAKRRSRFNRQSTGKDIGEQTSTLLKFSEPETIDSTID